MSSRSSGAKKVVSISSNDLVGDLVALMFDVQHPLDPLFDSVEVLE